MPLKKALARKSEFIAAFIPLPAILLGVLAMVRHQVSPVLWGQQVAAAVLFTMILWVSHAAVLRVPRAAWAAALVLPLFAVFAFPAAGGARRWIDLGLLNVNAAMLTLPALLMVLSGMERPLPALLLAAAALCLQPDLSQLTALTFGALPILFHPRRKPLLSSVVLALLLGLCFLCAARPVSLEPLDYCEGVLDLLDGVSPALYAAGALSLILIPLFFLFYFVCQGSAALLSLAAYYAAAILLGVTGVYPTPFMGFGLSPIAGYFLALLLLRALHTDHGAARLVLYANRMVKCHQQHPERSDRP